MPRATLTLTNANTNYNLLDLLSSVRTDPPKMAREITFQADSANTADILIGDSSLSATDYGFALAPGDGIINRSLQATISVGSIWLRSSSAGQKIHVTVIGA